MRYKVTRTIQPIGQGGFYTEIFEIPNQKGEISTRCVVYDCGSATRSEPKKTIESALPDDYDLDIDILFISHFDDDHVNGLAELTKKHRIKRLVIPQIQGYEWYYVDVNDLEAQIGIKKPIICKYKNGKRIEFPSKKEAAASLHIPI